MTTTLDRKGGIATVREAASWLGQNPVLIVAYLALGIVNALGELGVLAGLLSIVGLFVMLYVDGLSHLVARDEGFGETVDLSSASETVVDQFLSLIGIFIIYAVAVTIGLILLIIPGIYLALRLSLAFPACVIDRKDTFESIDASWDAAGGNLLKLLGITILAALVFGVATGVAALLTGLDETFFAVTVAVSAVVTAIVGPLVELAYARVYLENRDRAVDEPDDGDTTDEPWDDEPWDEGDDTWDDGTEAWDEPESTSWDVDDDDRDRRDR
ncbi:hypothetical protein [Natrialbaceae archaeon AArc-T1-2]|uniref:hypothetical protein n=1 Tax=Natrialbaceae archaeon AArc-T1-2 TaxID=3053904 RepID=UPI00255B30D8|nr:hypothetical protein [Natrialbaceae archaeon AArc-T1-2]WIV67635.1 hypothetical protein QQ977_02575 [Natrialbaceae archaeon AArc-T1-2]